MSLEKLEKTYGLTAKDEDLLSRVAYAMVVAGVWDKAVRRTDSAFDFFEIWRPGPLAAYRIGRLRDGIYVLFNLATGVRKYGSGLAEVLMEIAYVPPSR